MNDISGDSGNSNGVELVDALPALAPANRSLQVKQVLTLIEQGNSESASCAIVGINRNTFRAAAMREGAADTYARALTALAQEQINRVNETLERLEAKEIDPNAARVIIDTRKWFASKFLPKTYGERVQMEHSGNIGGGVEEMSEQAIRARLAELSAISAEDAPSPALPANPSE